MIGEPICLSAGQKVADTSAQDMKLAEKRSSPFIYLLPNEKNPMMEDGEGLKEIPMKNCLSVGA